MTTTKKLLIGAGVLGGGLLLMGFKRASNQIDAGFSLEYSLARVRDIGINGSEAWAEIDIIIFNPSIYDMSVSGYGLLTLREVRILSATNELIARAPLNRNSLEIKSGDRILIERIKIRASVFKAWQAFQNFDKLRIQGVVDDALGNTYGVEN